MQHSLGFQKVKWSTALSSIAMTWHNRRPLIQLSWFWVLISLPIAGALNWALHSWVLEAQKEGFFPGLVAAMVPEVVGMIAGASIAVAWHRLIILNDAPPQTPYHRLDIVVLKYFATTIALIALFFLPIVVGIAMVGGFAPPVPEVPAPNPAATNENFAEASCVVCTVIAVVVVPIVVAILGYLPARFMLALPAIALGSTQNGFAASWRATRCNYFRLYVGSLLICLLTIALSFLPFLFLNLDEPTPANAALTSIFGILTGFTVGMVGVTYMSLVYAQLLDPTHSAEPQNG